MYLQDRKGIKVCGEAADGFGAVENTTTLRPDLVLLDLVMPEMNGAEAASVMKKMMPKMPIIVFTMFSDNLGRSLASAIGVDMALSKPREGGRWRRLPRVCLVRASRSVM